MSAARAVAAEAITEAAWRKNDPADLINVALEKLVEGSFELPGYSTLDEMAGQIREEVNSSIFAMVADRLGADGVTRLDETLLTGGPGTKSTFNRLKRTAPRPSWTNYRRQIDHLRWVDTFGDARVWWRGVALSKITDFAGEADNHVPLVARHFRKDRASMLAMVGVLDLEATSADRSVLELLDYMREHTMLTRDHIPDRIPVFDEHGRTVIDELTGEQRMRIFDTSFASENWNKAIRDRARPGMFVRRHLEACVLTYLAEELRTGDIAVTGAQAYANWADQLLTPAEVTELLPGFCAEVGIPATAAAFRADLQARLNTQCRATDTAYPELADFAIDDAGRPSLKQYRAAPPTASAQALALALRDRMPERTLMGILARTAHWLEWWRRFAPASGSDPKLKDPFLRYVLTTFTYGTNLGPAQAARHIAGVTAHELATTSGRHVTIDKLNKAIADVVDAFTELDLIKVWGDGSVVAADGTQVDTFIDNLLAETSIRYGGTGGIAYHYVSDTYIALFSKFIPVGVWEAVHIIQGLLDQQSRVRPDTIHADTQGQALPVYALAHLCGFELMPRVRNWKDLNFYRPTPTARFRHIEALFGEPGRNVIDWDLIERHYDDLMRVVLSVAAGKISSVTLLRRLSTYSRRNNFYKAFREVGRVIRTIQLLRYLSDPRLRRRTTAATNKVESYNNFSAWCRFGNEGRVRDNDPAEQEKQIKFSTLLTNAVIFHTTLDMMAVLRQLAGEGWEITPDDLAVLSPYLTMRINRFGVYATDEISVTPEQYDAHLPDIDLTQPTAP